MKHRYGVCLSQLVGFASKLTDQKNAWSVTYHCTIHRTDIPTRPYAWPIQITLPVQKSRICPPSEVLLRLGYRPPRQELRDKATRRRKRVLPKSFRVSKSSKMLRMGVKRGASRKIDRMQKKTKAGRLRLQVHLSTMRIAWTQYKEHF